MLGCIQFGVADSAQVPQAQLRVQLVQSLKSEMRDLDSRQKVELRELKASQKARRKDFEKLEQANRREFFKKATRGSEKRAYVQEFLARRKSLIQFLNDELQSRKNEQDVRRKSLEDDQKRRLSDFDAAVARGERPALNPAH